MKIVTIGRDTNCDIVYDDDLISRRQAVLRLYPTGRIEIIDYSRNGTSVNGVKLAPEKLTRIHRGDAVTFAGVKSLDWKEVPDPSRLLKIIIASVTVIIVVLIAIWVFIQVRSAVVAHHASDAIENVDSDNPADTVANTPQSQERDLRNVDKPKKKIEVNGSIPSQLAPKPQPRRNNKEDGDKKNNGKTDIKTQPSDPNNESRSETEVTEAPKPDFRKRL